MGKGDVLWGGIDHSRVLEVLHNPRYAGAFVYGRRRTTYDTQLRSHLLEVPRDQWHTLIRDAHPGYITWDEFERNQVNLKQNCLAFGVAARGSAPREGPGLLQGRVLCGICGARMRTRYEQVVDGLVPYYQCVDAAVHRGGKRCQGAQGGGLDTAIGELLLEKVAPAALEVAMQVHDEISGRIEQADTLRRKQLERARYDADMARRRYLKVDPDNRLVADALEADWNDRLRQIAALQEVHDKQREADTKTLDAQARKRIAAIAADFPRVWHDPRTAFVERKRMIALLIEDVTLLIDRTHITAGIRWRGGQTSSIRVARTTPIAQVRKTKPEIVAALDQLLENCTDVQAVDRLNEMGHRNWRNRPFTLQAIRHMRNEYGLKSCYERMRAQGLLTPKEIAQHLGVSAATVNSWALQGILHREYHGCTREILYALPDVSTLTRPKTGRPRKTLQETTHSPIQ